MLQKKITAFPDGNSFIHYNDGIDKLIIGNSEGLIKVFNVHGPEIEPSSIDILENMTNLSLDSNTLALTTTMGQMELVDLKNGVSKGAVLRTELPLRDVEFINQGKRLICGGDDNKLIIVDLQDDNSSKNIELPDQVVNISYNSKGETLGVSLSNGHVQIYSVVNEEINLMNTLSNVIPRKINSSMDVVDYNNENNDELMTCTKTQWTSDGNYLLIPDSDHIIHVFERSTWKDTNKIFKIDERIIDFIVKDKYLVVLTKTVFKIFDINSERLIVEDDFELDDESLPLNVSLYKTQLFVGTTNGETITFTDVIEESRESNEASNLFVDDVGVSDNEELNSDIEEPQKRKFNIHEEDDLIIDEEDGFPDYKRQKSSPPIPINTKIVPYSQGSTPFENDRRYLTMNNHGYTWIVQNKEREEVKSISITVSFFDRSLNNGYHFTEYYSFDLGSMNQRGIILGESSTGSLYYRPHNEMSNDSWEKKIPLLDKEYITSLCITSSNSSNNFIVVGTNLGYLRVFNQYGICLNVIKTIPIITLAASSVSHIFVVHKVTSNVYNFSIIDIDQEYKFLQQNVSIPLTEHTPLIKGIFFNEFNDPCVVGGFDDTLLILHSWRESNNSRWVPILNCKNVITEYGSESKKNWNCWPLGVIDEKLNCLILKNGTYPGFPLPLPIELDLEVPTKIEFIGDEYEELFVRSITMGKILNDVLNDQPEKDVEDDIIERLNEYQNSMDKSLVNLFSESCQDSKLNKAYSVARLMKTDKALLATSKIAEKFEYPALATKIGQLREQLLDFNN